MENLVSKSIIITGYSGFIGSKITRILIESGYTVYGFYNHNKLPEKPGLTQIQVDLHDNQKVLNVLRKVKASKILHLAWYVGDDCHNSLNNLLWLNSSLNLLSNFIKEGGKEIIVSGSNEEYDLRNGLLKEESLLCNPSSLYGICKLSLYRILDKLCQKNNIPLKWARIFHTYGIGEQKTKLFSSVITSILKNKSIELSSCENYIDYINVEDVARCLALLVTSNCNGVFNVCSGETYKLKNIVKYICKELDYHGSIDFNAKKSKVESKIIIGDSTKLNSVLNFYPKVKLEDGIADLIKWWKRNV